jgi:hypothetical protein
MLTPLKAAVALAMLWAIVSLGYQVFAAWGGGRRDYSRRAGSPTLGIAYNFTLGMTPRHKESVRRHPVKFVVGLVLHLGVILSLLGVLLLLIWPALSGDVLSTGRPLNAVALGAGLYLLVRRATSPDLRAMSAPDDYIAILATCGLLAFACAFPDGVGSTALLTYAVLFFVYLPLGKLRHAVFFFVARTDLGRRLGYRGAYPPTTAGAR